MKLNYYNLFKYITNIIFDVVFIIVSVITLMLASYVIFRENRSIGEGTAMVINILFVFAIFSGCSKLLIDMYEYFNVHKEIVEDVCKKEMK